MTYPKPACTVEIFNQTKFVFLRFGYSKHTDPSEKIGWMVNMQPNELIDEEKRLVSSMDYYFIQGEWDDYIF